MHPRVLHNEVKGHSIVGIGSHCTVQKVLPIAAHRRQLVVNVGEHLGVEVRQAAADVVGVLLRQEKVHVCTEGPDVREQRVEVLTGRRIAVHLGCLKVWPVRGLLGGWPAGQVGDVVQCCAAQVDGRLLEAGQLDAALRPDLLHQQMIWGDAPVDEALVGEKVERLKKLLCPDGRLRLGDDGALLEKLHHVARGDVLLEDVDGSGVDEDVQREDQFVLLPTEVAQYLQVHGSGRHLLERVDAHHRRVLGYLGVADAVHL